MRPAQAFFLAAALVIGSVGAQSGRAQSPHEDGAKPHFDEALVTLGATLWTGKATCFTCHGAMGGGLEGASLRDTHLGLDEMVLAIRCGVAGTAMPAYDINAYVDDRCAAAKRENAAQPVAGLPNLSNREATAIASFVAASFAGTGAPTPEDCAKLWGEAAPTMCQPNAGVAGH